MTKNRAIVFIHKDKFEYYDEIQSKVFQFIYQPAVFQDLELVDIAELNKQLKTFVTANKLNPANILFIIANSLIFEKIFPVTAVTNKTLEIQNFLENIPFEHVSYKIIDDQKNCRILATNMELHSSLQSSFELLGFQSSETVAQPLLGQVFFNSPNLTLEMIKYILNNFDTLQKQGFGYGEVKNENSSDKPANMHDPVNLAKPYDKFRLPALVSVFVILLGVLGFVVYTQYTPPSKASPVPSTIVAPPILTPTPVPLDTPPSTPSATPT